jgi:ABC-type antimicrobial peptide transport system permease subunit
MAAGQRNRVAAALAAVMAVGAAAGAVGLWSGSIDFGEEITARLPWGSALVAGTALLVVVALPMTLAAVAAWRGNPRAPQLLLLAGLLLVGWIVVEVAFIRSFSWLQPVCAVWGALVAVLGLRDRSRAPVPGLSPGRSPGARRT